MSIAELAERKRRKDPTYLGLMVSNRTLSPERINELSEAASQNIVDGMIAQDLEDFDSACLHFSVAMRPLFPEFDSERILKAYESYTSALFAQSKLKDDLGHSKEALLHDERWEYIRDELVKMCQLLEIPKTYATETTDWFRYHAIKEDTYVKHLLEAHRILCKRVLGNDAWYRELAALYLCAIGLHDKHDREATLLGREIMRTYFNILFRAKAHDGANH